jgi:hypothetical protein
VVVAPAPAPAPAAPPAKTWKDLVTFEGGADAYYQVMFTDRSSLSSPAGSPIVVRSFDTNANTFTLNYAKLALGVNPEPVGLRIDLGYGATGVGINGPDAASKYANPFVIQQAYATAALGGLVLDMGKFATTAGAEVIESWKNWMYSRSIMFFYIPLVHTGLRGTYKVSDALTLQASVVNGWNGQGFELDVNPGKTYGLMANITLPSATNIILTTYFGKESPSTDFRALFDLVVAQTMGALALNLNVDYITDKKGGYDNYIGAALMGRYAVSDSFALALRAEYLQNDAWLTMGGDKIKLYEVTATAAFPIASRLEFRAEVRGDFATKPNFLSDKKQQFTGTGAFLAWF